MKMNKIDLKNLDKSTWSTFRFDQIASSISERVDPNKTDLKHYIGLDHIDSENIHITRMGSPDDVNGQKLRCYPGDVIFGRRRAYQRKAAVCDVDGFCSAHSLVLRANPEVIDPQLFPFFLHSDAFMHRAVDISVGSLSPTINWGTLKKQEFLLPPNRQQAQLAELLWAMDRSIQTEICLFEALELNVDTYINSLYSKSSEKIEKIKNTDLQIIDGDRGKNYPKSSDYLDDSHGHCLFLNAGNVTRRGFEFLDNQFISESKDKSLRNGKLQRGDIVITTRGTVGNIAHYDSSVLHDHVRINSGMVILRNTSEKISTSLLYKLLQSRYFLSLINRLSYGSAQPQLSVKVISEIELPVFSKNVAEVALSTLSVFEQGKLSIIKKKSASQSLQKSLISQVF
ncbi:MAG: restriction endonuclease subunit S [Thiomicrorhabdus sp.]|jgi:type I restriction enzyme S subunit|nr:restriction endonuclease subunit S [Thiomicrorhabdus sp.]